MRLMTQSQQYVKLMQKNILVDLNIVLDVFLERKGYAASQHVLELNESSIYKIYISAHAITTLSYLLESNKIGKDRLSKNINWVLQVFQTVSVDSKLLRSALLSNVNDYEDAVVEQSALACSAEVIITRNIKDFKFSRVPALTPEDFIKQLG
jgi:predicted nucleic acid-binding protein